MKGIAAEAEALRDDYQEQVFKMLSPVQEIITDGDYDPEKIEMEREYRDSGRQYGKMAQLDAAEQAIKEQNPDARILRVRPDTDTSQLKGNMPNIFDYTPEIAPSYRTAAHVIE